MGSEFGVPRQHPSNPEPWNPELVERRTANAEPETVNTNREHEPGTWNQEPGTAMIAASVTSE
jgi:hypothetical protein